MFGQMIYHKSTRGEDDIMAASESAADDPSKAVLSSVCGGRSTPNSMSEVPGSLPEEELLVDLADLFKVFSDTTRIKILFTLMGRDLCVADIADATGTTQSAVSHQLRTLKQAHLVKFKRDGRNIVYSLADDHVYTMLNQGLTHICE